GGGVHSAGERSPHADALPHPPEAPETKIGEGCHQDRHHRKCEKSEIEPLSVADRCWIPHSRRISRILEGGEQTQGPVPRQREGKRLARGAPSRRLCRYEPVGEREQQAPARTQQQEPEDHSEPLDSPAHDFLPPGLARGGSNGLLLIDGTLNDW